ncbi:hypothetical protein ACE3I0_22060 [Enterobacter hormaechei subsp. hoffmannii]|uniref:hypothetical protein n=1 Tax=Enterobacter hormaechei TaxID=158836 RepID=UPI0035C5DAFE
MTDNKLTEGQLLFRLQDFYGAEQDALKMGDYEFAQECSDIVSVIRELQEFRKANSAGPIAMKDHELRELVNALLDIAIEYHGTQQLRDRIARTVSTAMLKKEN